LESGIDNWKSIAKSVGLRNGQEAINEFLKARSTPVLLGKEATESLRLDSYKYLADHAR
jgi:hypothetical protein